MELLATEFKEMAAKAGISSSKIEELIGQEMAQQEIDNNEDLTWRNLNEKAFNNQQFRLLNNSISLYFNKILKREIRQKYQMFYDLQAEKIILLGHTNENTLQLESFESYSEFENFAIANDLDFPAMDFQNTSTRHLSKEAFSVFGLLVELFIEKYPYPNPNWEPDELLTFTINNLSLIQQDSNLRYGPDTWWQHVKKILLLADLTADDIELGMAQLAHKELIGYMDEIEGQDVFYIGKDLNWYIRGIVWWDKGFAISEDLNQTRLMLFQASALFVLITEGDNDYSLFNIDGKTLQQYLKRYLEIVREKREYQPGRDVSTGKPTKSVNFCSNCGYKLEIDAHFCPECGHKIK